MNRSKPQYLSLILLLIGSVLLTSCTTDSCHRRANERCADTDRDNNAESGQISAILWFRYAAEARALYYQAYNIARDRLDAAMADNNSTNQLAVIVDIDETVLDNSPFQASLVKRGVPFSSKLWTEWCDQSQSQALAGAERFLNYAASRGVNIFYISKRNTNVFSATRRNLLSLGFPMVDARHLLLQKAHEGKELYRRNIGQKYEVVLLMGDNLDDFSTVFDKDSIADRFDVTGTNRAKFGRQFIVLPNPMYGDWESVLYQRKALNEQQKAKVRWGLLQQLSAGKQPGAAYSQP